MATVTKYPNTKTVYIRDENLLSIGDLSSFSGFVNWCLDQKELRDKFNELKDAEKKL